MNDFVAFRKFRLVGYSALVALAVGCQPASETADSTGSGESSAPKAEVNTELQGKINIDGSSTVYPISENAASKFRELYPNVNIPVGSSGTGNGIERFVKGEIEIADASRPMKAEEFEIAKQNGVAFVEVPIAYDGLTIVVHKDNDFVDQLSVDDLKKIFTTEGNAKTWADVREGWPAEPIALFAPGTDSGTFDYFKEVVAKDGGSIRSDMSTSEDDIQLVTGVAGSPNEIGFFGVAYYEENRERLRAVPVVDPASGEAVLPLPENIDSGKYSPFSRPLFIYVASSKLSRPDVKRFVDFYLESAPMLAKETGYVSLPAAIYELAKENIKQRQTGTHYVTAEGKKRQGAVMEVYVPENRLGF